MPLNDVETQRGAVRLSRKLHEFLSDDVVKDPHTTSNQFVVASFTGNGQDELYVISVRPLNCGEVCLVHNR